MDHADIRVSIGRTIFGLTGGVRMKSAVVASIITMGFILWGGFVSDNAHAAETQIAVASDLVMGLKSDGTVLAAGEKNDGRDDVSEWTDVIQVSTGKSQTIGLKSDGTVLATGSLNDGLGNVASWTDIKQISVGNYHTIGLKTDGTALAAGRNNDGRGNVTEWADIKQVSAGGEFTVGLKNDGTALSTGFNNYGQGSVSSWTTIKQISAGEFHTVGVKTDGTVIATGRNNEGQGDVSSWRYIRQVSAGEYHTVGLKSDGTVVATGRNNDGRCNVSSWTDIKQIAARSTQTLGLKTDGTIVATGENVEGLYEIFLWELGSTLSQTQVSQLYVSIFGRASEGDGNSYWRSSQDDMITAANAMLATEAAKTYFGSTLNDNQLFIEFIYKNTLGKTYSQDPDGIDYWIGELANGKSKGQVIATLINAVMDSEYAGLPAQDQFINKVAVSDYTADLISTVPDAEDLTAFVGFISGVTDDSTTVTNAKSAVDEFQ